MSEVKGKKKSWPEVATIRKGDDGTSYIKLAEGVEILLNGEKVPLNQKRTLKLEDPRKKVEGLFDRGFIDEAQRDQRLEKLSDMAWLRYTVVAPPPRDV